MIVSESRHRGKPSAEDGGAIGGVSPAGFSNVAAAFSHTHTWRLWDHSPQRRNTRDVLMPPNAKLLLITYSAWSSRP